MHSVAIFVAVLLPGEPGVVYRPDTVQKYLAALYSAIRTVPSDARVQTRLLSNGVENTHVSWGRFYLDYNLGQDADDIVYFCGDYLLGVSLDSARITVDITSSAHSDGVKYYAKYGKVRPRKHRISSRQDFWQWLNPPKQALPDMGP